MGMRGAAPAISSTGNAGLSGMATAEALSGDSVPPLLNTSRVEWIPYLLDALDTLCEADGEGFESPDGFPLPFQATRTVSRGISRVGVGRNATMSVMSIMP